MGPYGVDDSEEDQVGTPQASSSDDKFGRLVGLYINDEGNTQSTGAIPLSSLILSSFLI